MLALVSFPSYDPTRFNELYPVMRDDTERLPLHFRGRHDALRTGLDGESRSCAWQGWGTGKIGLDTTFVCTGYLFPDVRDKVAMLADQRLRRPHGPMGR